MKIINLKKGDKLMYVKDEQMVGAYYKGQVDIVHSVDINNISIRDGIIGIPYNGLCENYKFVKEDGTLEDITTGIEYLDFIAIARHLGWVCYQLATDNAYNIEPDEEQINVRKQGILYAYCFPESKPEEIYNNRVYNDGVSNPKPFNELSKTDKDKYMIVSLIYKEFSKLWHNIFEYTINKINIKTDKVEFIARARFITWICYQLGANQPYNFEPTKDQLDSLINGVKFGLNNPNATPESNHENWMRCKLEQGWVYGVEKDLEKKTHFDLVPFDELIKVEKDKDIMDCIMNREFSKLWDRIFE